MDPLQKKYIFDRETRLREAFTQNNFGAAVDIFAGQPVADPQAALRKSAAAAWMKTRSGRKEIDPTSPLWQGQKEGLAQGYFKVAEPKGISDDDVFNLIKADYQARQDVAELSFNAWAKGMQPTQMFNEWAAKGADNPAKGRWGDYQQELSKTYSKLYAENEQYREMIDRNAAKVVAGNTAGFKEFADELMTVPENKQRLIIRAMAAKASQNPDEQRAWYAKLGEGMGRMAESLVGATESGYEAMKGSSLVQDSQSAGFAADVATFFLGADSPQAQRARGMSEQLRSEGMAQYDTARDYYSLVNMIRKTADEKIDPVTMENWLGSSVLEVSRMTPMIGASLVPIAGQATLVSWFRDDVSSNLMLENDNISRESADAIANIAAVPLAATETVSSLVPLGKLPFLSKFLKQGVSTWTRAAARGAAFTATGVVVENLEEATQQIIPNYVQNFFAALREDVDYVNFAEQERQLMKLPGQVTGPALILSLIGGGVTSVSAVRNGRALASDSDLMIATGISPEVAQQINAAAQTGNWQQVDQLFTGAFNKDKGGYDGATDEQRQQAAQAFIAKQTQAQAAEKTLEMTGALAPIRRFGDQWQILPSDGSAPVSFGTFEQANAARWQDAKMKNIRLDGITRQAIEQADRMLQEGQSNAYEFSAEEMTKELAVQRGLVTEEQAGKREKQAAALDEGKVEDDLYRASMNEASAQGDTDPVTVILGMSSLEMREGIQTGVVRLFKGANFTDLIEEISETSLKRYLQSGDVQQQQMVSKLRDVERRLQAMEQADGQAPSLLFRTSNDAELTSEDVIEAFSHLAKSYYLNAAEKGIGWRKQDKNLPRYLRRLRASIEQTGFYTWIKTLGSKLRSIFMRAAQLEKLRTEGQLDADLETLIRRSVGLETQAQFEKDTVKEAQSLADEVGGATMSAGQAPQAGTLEERLAAMFDPFQKSPELRRKIGVAAQERVTKIAQQLGEVLGSTAKTQEKLAELDTKYSEELAAAKADYDAEVAALRDERDLEMNGARVDGKSKEDIQKINTEYTRKIGQRQREWERQKGELETRQANERAAINKGLAGLSAEGVVQALRTLNAAVSALPVEVRAKILPGGAVKIARLKTTEQRIAAIEQIVQRADVELEKWLKKEIGGAIAKRLKSAKAKGEGGEIPKSKLTVSVQDEIDEINRISFLNGEQTVKEMAEAEALITVAETSEQASDAMAQMALLEMFGDIFGKGTAASQMNAALEYLDALVSKGRSVRKALDEARSSEVKAMVQQAKVDAFKGVAGPETEALNKDKGQGTVKGTLKNFARELFSHRAVLSSIFGESNKTADTFDERLILNTNAFEDTQNDRRKRLRDFMRQLYETKSTVKLNQATNKLESRKANSGVTIVQGRKTVRDVQDVEAVRRIVEDPKAFGYSEKEVQAWKDELDAWAALPEGRKRQLFIERELEAGQRVELALSQMEAVYLTMALRQPGILEQQEQHGYDQKTLDQAEAFLKADAKAWRQYLQAEYDAEYEVANAVFMRLFNTRMPQIKFYAPLLKNHQGQQASLDPLDAGTTKQSVNPGSIKSRSSRTSSLRIESAIAVYQSHFAQMDYWVHMAEYLRDVQAVMLNSEVKQAIVSGHGSDAMRALTSWVQLEMSRGAAKGTLSIQASKLMRNIKTGLIYKALAFNIGTAIKSADSAFRSLGEIPLNKWPKALADGFKHWNKLKNSKVMQNRLELGGTVELREINANAGRAKWFVVDWLEQVLKKGSFPTQYADLVLTSYSGAMAYGNAYEESKQAGATDEQADAYALKRAEIVIARTSMPTNAFQKSLMEADSTGLANLFMLFASDPRQKASLSGEALMKWLRGKSSNEEVVRKLLANWIIPGIIFQTANAIVQSLFRDNDDEWTIEDYITAAVVGPLQGVAVLGSTAEILISMVVAQASENLTDREAKREKIWMNAANPLQQTAVDFGKSLNKLPERLEDGEYFRGAWDVFKAGALLTTPFNPAGAAPSTLDRVVKDTNSFLFSEEQ